jgi:hypothetical protein
MTLVAFILLAVCCIVLGAVSAPKPVGWAVVGLAVLALLLVVLGGLNVSISR